MGKGRVLYRLPDPRRGQRDIDVTDAQRRQRVHVGFRHRVGRISGVEYWVEPHDLSRSTDEAYLGALDRAGLSVWHDPEGLEGRGLFVGLKPPDQR